MQVNSRSAAGTQGIEVIAVVVAICRAVVPPARHSIEAFAIRIANGVRALRVRDHALDY